VLRIEPGNRNHMPPSGLPSSFLLSAVRAGGSRRQGK
jgi:hypothetical protein